MANGKRGRPRKVQNEFGEEVEIETQDEAATDDELTPVVGAAANEQTFAESPGVPANAHAKELARKTAAEKKKIVPHGVFYTLKGASKVIKVIVKLAGAYEVYIGNMNRHKDGLAPLIKGWEKQGVWVKPHEVEEKIKKVREDLKQSGAVEKKKA